MFAKNIRYLRKKRNWTQNDLAKRLGYNALATINKWETGVNRAPSKKLEMIAALFNVSVDDLLNTDLEQRDLDIREGAELKADSVRIKVYERIHAGIPNEAIDEVVDWQDIPREWTAGGREYFGLIVKGDCMYPKYQEGDVIIVRKQDTCESGQDCVVYIDRYEAELKKVILNKDSVILQPLNPKYEPKVYTEGIAIAGIVIEIRRKV